MCKQSTIRKIDAGTHVVVPKWWPWLTGIFSPAAIIAFAFYYGGYTTNVEARIPATPQEKAKVFNHIEDRVVHLTYEEKANINLMTYKVGENSEKLDKIIKKLNID